MLENMVVCGWITYRRNIRSDTEVWYDLANYIEVNEVAYELLEDIENECLRKHKPKHVNSFVEMYQLRTQARMIA